MFKVFVVPEKRGMRCSSSRNLNRRGEERGGERGSRRKDERKRGREANIAREREREVAIG